MTVKLFKAGNSDVVAIPKPLLQEWGIKTGQELTLEKVPDSDALIISPRKKKAESQVISAEFRRWLKMFLDEDGQLLDRLA